MGCGGMLMGNEIGIGMCMELGQDGKDSECGWDGLGIG